MKQSYEIRELLDSDYLLVREVYEDSIQSQGHHFYNKDQINAWSSLARLPGVLDQSLEEGKGWVSCYKGKIEAFAVRYPINRLALLYCRGRSSRQGHATLLLNKIEIDAKRDKQRLLSTEASLFSYPLLIRCGWIERSLEKIKIAGVPFDRYLMEKKLI
tara:strand:+ start:10635 stop:11111 length:477 start_codon:yes stop_codon:yes gene_type:complete